MARKKTSKATPTPPAPAASSGPSISIGGNVSGPVIVGNGNTSIGSNSGNITIGSHIETLNTWQQTNLARVVSPAEIEELAQAFQDLRQAVVQAAPPALAAEAAQQAAALQTAVTSPKPDVTAMGNTKAWFAEHLPAILGGVTGLLTNPIIGKLVQAAGEFTVDQFRERLGLPAK